MDKDITLVRRLLLMLQEKERVVRPNRMTQLVMPYWEENPFPGAIRIPGYDVDQIDFHLKLLVRYNYVDGDCNDCEGINFRCITTAGDAFLSSQHVPAVIFDFSHATIGAVQTGNETAAHFHTCASRHENPPSLWDRSCDILKASRGVLSALMNSYYGVNPASVGDTYQPDSPVCDGVRVISSEFLRQVRLDDFPVLLMMRPAWLPGNLIPLAELDKKKKWGIHSAPKDIDPGLVANLRKYIGIETTDDPTYHILDDTVEGGLPSFAFYRSTYYRYQNSGESLSWELAAAYAELPLSLRMYEKETIAEYAGRVGESHVREHVQAYLNGALDGRRGIAPFDFKSRSVGLGINTLTVIVYRDESATFFLHNRGTGSEKLSEGIGQLHVCPAGTFQPLCRRDDKRTHDFEFSFEHNVMREFGEEMLGKETLFRSLGYETSPENIYLRDDELKKAKGLFDQGYIEQYYLGCGLDLVSLKMEMLTLLLIHGDKYRDSGLPISGSKYEGELAEGFPVFSKEVLLEKFKAPKLMPAGAGCIARSYLLFDEIQECINSLLKR